jgi:hypothetical protein
MQAYTTPLHHARQLSGLCSSALSPTFTRLLPLLLILIAFFAVPNLKAQAEPVDSTVLTGATVRIQVPVLSPGWRLGTVVEVGTPARCLGVALDSATTAPDDPGVVLLSAISALHLLVESPTSQGAADSTWRAVSLSALRRQDVTCKSPSSAPSPH